MADKEPRTIEEVCKSLDKLVQKPGYIYALAAMLRHDMFLDPAEAADINWRERLSYQEFTFLSGLLIKYPLDLAQPGDKVLGGLIKQTYELFKELHASHFNGWMAGMVDEYKAGKPTPENFEEKTRAVFGGSSMTEPIFYGGSGAYDFQYCELAPERYSLDHDWLVKNKHLDVSEAAKIVADIKSSKGGFFERKSKNSADRNQQMLDLFTISPNDLKGHDSADVQAVFTLFSVGFGEANKSLTLPGQYNVLNSHPLIKLTSDKYFMPVHFNLAQSLYESPYYWMIGDEVYKDQSLKNRGTATESIADRMLAGVFGRRNVYKNVKIYRGKNVIAEIDVLAFCGNRAIVVQSKSKRLTELSRTGDAESLESDFKKAIQQGYEQGLDCRKALLNPNGLKFTVDDKQINVPSVKDAYILCLVSDHYPALTHQAHIYLTKAAADPYPVAMSVFDLDVMTYYLSNPYELLYYLRQRIDTADYFHATEEMALLAYHLRAKLFKRPDADRESIDDSMAQLIDANFPVAKGKVPRTEAADRLHHTWKNDEFEKLVAAIQNSGTAEYIDALFLLYDMAGDAVDRLMAGIQQMKAQSQSDNQKHSLSIQSTDNNVGISYVVTSNPSRVEGETLVFGQAKKYRTKSEAWLALGGYTPSPNLIDVLSFNDEPWVEDPELEQYANLALRPGATLGEKPKIGRNEPCPCGSGKKFKKCHGGV
jgi:hypothetical protein